MIETSRSKPSSIISSSVNDWTISRKASSMADTMNKKYLDPKQILFHRDLSVSFKTMWNNKFNLSRRKSKEHQRARDTNTICTESSDRQHSSMHSHLPTFNSIRFFLPDSRGILRSGSFQSSRNGELSHHDDQTSHRSFPSKPFSLPSSRILLLCLVD